MQKQQARDISLELFIAMSGDEQMMRNFLLQSGLQPEEIRDHIHKDSFLLGILDYVMSWEEGLISLCQKAEIAPELISSAHRSLGGHISF